MKRAVLFDMDGILYDSERFYMDVTLGVMRSLGYTGPEERLHAVVGATGEGTWKILYDLLEGNVTRRDIEQAWIAANRANPLDCKAVMFADIPDTLRRLRAHGLKTACCSSSPVSVIEKSLEEMEIREYFDYTVSSEELPRPKPDPMIYLLAAETLGLKPEECAVYEDSRMGIEAGKRAGMTVIARRDTRFSQDQSRADKLVMTSAEMADYVLEEKKHA
ncbi:MAG: HAD family phosphatase [Solobacterium sp.]|nr:HAD family phosphatase [Solobacterium sp.]